MAAEDAADVFMARTRLLPFRPAVPATAYASRAPQSNGVAMPGEGVYVEQDNLRLSLRGRGTHVGYGGELSEVCAWANTSNMYREALHGKARADLGEPKTEIRECPLCTVSSQSKARLSHSELTKSQTLAHRQSCTTACPYRDGVRLQGNPSKEYEGMERGCMTSPPKVMGFSRINVMKTSGILQEGIPDAEPCHLEANPEAVTGTLEDEPGKGGEGTGLSHPRERAATVGDSANFLHRMSPTSQPEKCAPGHRHCQKGMNRQKSILVRWLRCFVTSVSAHSN
ncbi:hypothetical protein TREES_T100014542 [Tupaia chinensis]|uniref:Uncharacterized protein n=1 Tax=Tupaia chinensis TaxID=246437 RepID=L9LCN7_TUPCH|nr:hypothetical protein TREES_T100014542 [Tupaia chinensis]